MFWRDYVAYSNQYSSVFSVQHDEDIQLENAEWFLWLHKNKNNEACRTSRRGSDE